MGKIDNDIARFEYLVRFMVSEGIHRASFIDGCLIENQGKDIKIWLNFDPLLLYQPADYIVALFGGELVWLFFGDDSLGIGEMTNNEAAIHRLAFLIIAELEPDN